MPGPLLLLPAILILLFVISGCASLSCQDAVQRYQARYAGIESIQQLLDLEIPAPDAPPSAQKIPGAQVVFGNREKVLFSIERGRLSAAASPAPENRVTAGTLFDLASLTKPLVTATGILLLQERGMLKISDPLNRFIPEYEHTPLGNLTLEQLLRHRSGLPDTPEFFATERAELLERAKQGENLKSVYLRKIAGLMPAEPRHDFSYSDPGYILLAIIIERVSGMPLEDFARKEIFTPLGMTHSTFRPPAGSSCARAARVCQPNDDPTFYYLGGVSGSAGLYSTALDLAIFARMILNGGLVRDNRGNPVRFLQQASVVAMTSDPDHTENLRGLGWDLDTAYSCAPRGIFPKGSFGHSGYTGTSMWMDPSSGLFVIILTNEVDARKGLINPLRWKIAELVARSNTE